MLRLPAITVVGCVPDFSSMLTMEYAVLGTMTSTTFQIRHQSCIKCHWYGWVRSEASLTLLVQ